MDVEINDLSRTLITNSAAIFRFQYNTQTIWTWSQPLHIPSSAFHPLNYNNYCSYHRNHISLKFFFIHILNQEVERLIQNLI